MYINKSPANATFKITDIRFYVPVFTLLTEKDKKLLEQLRTGFQSTIKWNRCRWETTNRTKNNNLNYLIDPIFIQVNRLFVLSFENENVRTSFSKYYVPNVQIKDFFDTAIENDEETYKQIIEKGRNKITQQAIYWLMNTFPNYKLIVFAQYKNEAKDIRI